ncbi:DUF2974 domain-containing protein [bacterium]|nr:DUF2974 domain-containing protein [bacterium]
MARNFTPNVYKKLCSQSSKMSMKNQRDKEAFDGWYVKDNYYDPKSNFRGVLYEKDGKYALAFAGTDKKSYQDWAANAKMAFTGESKQIKQAREFSKDMMDKYSLTPENTVSIGHSEGGNEATHVGIENELPTFTFNAFGVRKSDYPDNYDDLVTNYRDPHDPVSKLKRNVGKTYITPNIQTWIRSHTPFGSIQAHGIDNMGDTELSVPVEQYKKNNPMFLDAISDAEITREDIGRMDSGLFSLYEGEINDRLSHNQILADADIEERLRRMGIMSGRGNLGYYKRLTTF